MGSIPEVAPGGRRLAGYRLGEFLGNGLAGRVHAGWHAASGMEVAIELIAAPWGADPAFRRRLIAEAARAAELDHPLVLGVREAVAAGEDEMGMVTDPYRGVPLAAVVPDEGMPVAATMLITDAVLLALVQSHRAGIVHRAVEAETVIVDESGRIRLAGFALGSALRRDLPAAPSTDTWAVATLAATVMRGGSGAAEGAIPRQLRSVVRRGTSEKRRYQTAAGMRTALTAAARHDIGPDWRELAMSELVALFSGQGADVDGVDLLLEVPPTQLPAATSGVTAAAEADAPPSAAEPEQIEELPLGAPPSAEPRAALPPGDAPHDEAPRAEFAPALVALTPVIRGVPEARRSRRLHGVLVATGLIAACIAVGVTAGVIVSAVRGGGLVAGGPLRVGAPVSLKVEPVQGSCNSVFVATATAPVQGQGTLVYRWERSDGLRSANTALPVAATDSSFLITQHWALSGAVAHPAITFRVVSPMPMTVTRQLQYSCP